MWRMGVIGLLCVGVSGCGSINSFLAAKTADLVPVWAGGLPADAPPRPGDPRYAQFEKELNADLAAPKGKKAKEEKPDETPAATPASPR